MRRLLTPRMRKWLISLSLLYLAIIAVDIVLIAAVIPDFKEIRHFQGAYSGCFLTDALVGYVACQYFPGSRIVYWLVNLPLLLLYLPIFGVMILARIHTPWVLLKGIALWLPILFLAREGVLRVKKSGPYAVNPQPD